MLNVRKKCRMLSLIIAFLILLSQPCFSFLKRDGKRIVDSEGNEVLLRGIGLGGWLVPEGYQLHIPGFGSPTSIRNKIIDLIGQQSADQFFQLYRENYVKEDDIAQISALGFNSIRLPFNYRLLSPEYQPGIFLEEGFQVIDQLLRWCEKYRLYLILDMHCAPGGQNKDNISDSDGIEARLWTDPSNKDRTIEIWQKLAERYSDEEWLGGYDLLNEPVLPPGYPNTDLRILYMKITQAIREKDTNHIIFIEGNWYATDFNSLTPPFDVNMVYSFHKYWNENTQQSIQSYLNIRNTHHIPVWLGESGENSNPWYSDCVRLMENNNIGWCWWTHKKVETITSPYSSPITSEYQVVLDYWNGKVTRPSVDFAREALFEMAQNLCLDRCEFHYGVLDALFRIDYSSRASPFQQQFIPGDVQCVNYDLGNINVAYGDTDYQKVRWDIHQPWNQGYKYRNDGVDIDLSGDSNGAVYYVGWIEAGEWLSYTVNVDQTAIFDINIRVASSNDNGRFKLYIDNDPITGIISVPNTGGWKDWSTLSVPQISIPGGTHLLKLIVYQGGFNINLLRFDYNIDFIRENFHFEKVTDNIMFAQNYPNPFNHSTQIPVFLIQPQEINLTVYNSKGAAVKTLFDGSISTGLTILVWDGTDTEHNYVASGVYYVRLSTDRGNFTKSMIFQK